MARLQGERIVDPDTLDSAELERVVDQVYAVHDAIFAGVDRESFRRYVFESGAERTRIQLNLGIDGTVVGYNAMHFYVREFCGRPCTVLRVEMGLLRAYRGRSGTGLFMPRELLRWKLLHPSHRMFSQSSPVHPATYALFGRYTQKMWPHWEGEVPEPIEAFLFSLAEEFGLEAVDPSNPYIRRVGWITRQSESEAAFWAQSEKPAAAFYIDQNPGYTEGHGLLTLLALDVSILTGAVASFGLKRLRELRARWLPAFAPAPAATIEALRSVPMLEGLPDEALREATTGLARIRLPAGEVLFRAGDVPQDLYLLRRGAVFILAGEGREEQVISQLGPGALLGELGVLMNRPRSATVRAASSCELYRLSGAQLLRVVGMGARSPDAFWRTVLQRQLETWLRGRVDAASRPWRSLADRARWVLLSAGEQRLAPAGGALVLLSGELELLSAHGPTLVSAPAWLPALADSVLRARTPLRLAVISDPGRRDEAAASARQVH